MINIAIFGSTGYIASNIAKCLYDEGGYKLYGTSRKPDLLNIYEHHYQVNINSLNNKDIITIRDILSKVSVIIIPIGLAHINVDTFDDDQINVSYRIPIQLLDLLDTNKKMKIIYVSSISALTCNKSYGVLRRLVELEIIEYAKNRPNISYLILRLPVVYGRNAPGNFESLVRLVNCRLSALIANIHTLKSILYVKNIGDFISHALKYKYPSDIYYISDGKELLLSDIIKILVTHSQVKQLNINIFFIKVLHLIIGFSRLQKKIETLRSQLSISRFEKHNFNWTPKFDSTVGLKELLKKENTK
jgi:nucleoside-diphosphate-sugar epimerase